MSVKNVEAFLENASEMPELAERIENLNDLDNSDDVAKAFIELGKELGLEFSSDDLMDMAQQIFNMPSLVAEPKTDEASEKSNILYLNKGTPKRQPDQIATDTPCVAKDGAHYVKLVHPDADEATVVHQ